MPLGMSRRSDKLKDAIYQGIVLYCREQGATVDGLRKYVVSHVLPHIEASSHNPSSGGVSRMVECKVSVGAAGCIDIVLFVRPMPHLEEYILKMHIPADISRPLLFEERVMKLVEDELGKL